jgi:hypothetical protein
MRARKIRSKKQQQGVSGAYRLAGKVSHGSSRLAGKASIPITSRLAGKANLTISNKKPRPQVEVIVPSVPDDNQSDIYKDVGFLCYYCPQVGGHVLLVKATARYRGTPLLSNARVCSEVCRIGPFVARIKVLKGGCSYVGECDQSN